MKVLVRLRRLELPRVLPHSDLNAARLPVPPQPHFNQQFYLPLNKCFVNSRLSLYLLKMNYLKTLKNYQATAYVYTDWLIEKLNKKYMQVDDDRMENVLKFSTAKIRDTNDGAKGTRHPK